LRLDSWQEAGDLYQSILDSRGDQPAFCSVVDVGFFYWWYSGWGVKLNILPVVIKF
jgi:hypothetical protein